MRNATDNSTDRPNNGFPRSGVSFPFWRRAALILALASIAVIFLLVGAVKSRPTTVIYAAQDRIYAEPILRQFESKTQTRVGTVYDSEAVKTVGLVNRLLAERKNPQCDVFWGNEEFRTRQLASQGVFRETNAWAAFGYRSRRIVINTNKLTQASAPRGLLELTNKIWRGRIVLAYPLFGTTGTHFLALRQYWGDPGWQAWCRALQANKPFVVDGNSVVVQFVGRGEAWIGLTDSDDIAAGQREGLPVMGLPLTAESLLIPNTVAVPRGAPHPEAAQRLFEYLQTDEVIQRLVQANALEGASPEAVKVSTLKPDWEALLRELEPATVVLKEIFLR